MKNQLKIFTIFSLLFCIIFGGTLFAASQNLTDELKGKVAAILSNYDPTNLSVADAKAINNAFREACVRPGPGQKAAIEAAGFDPQKISSLDPPPEKAGRSERPHKRNDSNVK